MYNLNYFRKLQHAKIVKLIDKDGVKHYIILGDEDVQDQSLMTSFDLEYGKIIDIETTRELNKKSGNKVNIKEMKK